MVKSIPIVVNCNSIIFDVHNGQVETIGEFSQRIRREKGLSTQQVADNSGGLISQSYVSKIENEPFVDVTIPRLQGLAKGLAETEQKVFDVIRGKTSNREEINNERFRNLAENFSVIEDKDRLELEILFKFFEREVDERKPKRKNPLDAIELTSEREARKKAEKENAASKKDAT